MHEWFRLRVLVNQLSTLRRNTLTTPNLTDPHSEVIFSLNFENQWNDEIFTFWATDPKITFSETFSRVNQFESIPVLYFLLVKSLHALFGYSPDIGRYFSALFGVKYSRVFAYFHLVYYVGGQWLTFFTYVLVRFFRFT